jgi:subtilisin family serine protease
MRTKWGLVIVLILYNLILIPKSNIVCAQHGPKYWVQFADKSNSSNSINKPLEYLSSRAIQRRIKNNIEITVEDLPISKIYSDSLSRIGVKVLYSSKWFNSVTIETNNDLQIETIKKLSFVKNIEKTADPLAYKKAAIIDKNNLPLNGFSTISDSSYYGNAYKQISVENGVFLHKSGFRGKGVIIAIIDAGFYQADQFSSLDSARQQGHILGTRDFVEPGNNVYNAHLHGAEVLSSIAGLQPGTLVGTAPDASFWLLRSEDAKSEYPVEEDNWVPAAELADSAGADVINTSLGYTEFSDSIFNHRYSDLNGETSRNSIAASIAASKGIIVVVSAGNDGNKSWHFIGTPADAKNILAVGAINSDRGIANFSSFGPTSDGRIKPDITALGVDATVQSAPDKFGTVSGTSLSSPLISGLTACLVQAFPNETSSNIIDAIKMSADRYNNPNDTFGYGIPDFQKAYYLLEAKEINEIVGYDNKNILAFPNPFSGNITFKLNFPLGEKINITCYNITGEKIFEISKKSENILYLSPELNILNEGLYLFTFKGRDTIYFSKVVKRKPNN